MIIGNTTQNSRTVNTSISKTKKWPKLVGKRATEAPKAHPISERLTLYKLHSAAPTSTGDCTKKVQKYSMSTITMGT